MGTAAAVWKQLTQFGPFRWGSITPGRALRVTFGVVLPLVLGWLGGRVEYGAFAALGALPAGFASFQGEARGRIGTILAACIGMSVSTFVGATVVEVSPWLLPPMVALWGYMTGLAVSLGPRFAVAVLQWSLALLIAVGLPATPSEAGFRAVLVLAGALFQAALVAVSWLLRPGLRERTALAASYRGLAAYAAEVAAGKRGPPPASALPAAELVADPNPLVSATARLNLVSLLEQAERIRASLAAVAVHAGGPGTPEFQAFMRDAAKSLELAAAALAANRGERVAALRALRQSVSRRAVPPEAPWRWAGEALLGQLRAVGRIVARLQSGSPGSDVDAPAQAAVREQGGFAAALTTLRANITLSGEAGRHALRLAAVATLAEALVQAVGLYQGRWVTLTIFIVLKPDYSSTLFRGAQRALGTIIGTALGAATVQLAYPGQAGLIAASGIFIAAAYALFDVSYLLFGVPLTAFILTLLALLGAPAAATAEARLLDTVIGSALAIAAYAIWPTWEGVTAPEKFARMFAAHRDYLRALLREVETPGEVGAVRLRALQIAARRARSDAEAATARLSDEPPRSPLTADVAEALIAAIARLALAELGLHAFSLSPRNGASRPELEAFAEAVCAAMDRLAVAVRTLAAPQAIPPLRQLQRALWQDQGEPDDALAEITDRMVDAIDSAADVLRNRLDL